MVKEKTLSIIKPDGVCKNVIGDIINRFEKAGLKIAAAKMIKISEKQGAELLARLIADRITESGLIRTKE